MTTWIERYHPPDQHNWQGRADAPERTCFFQMVQRLDLTKNVFPSHPPRTFGLIGFCCDEGIRRNLGRPGAVEGPLSIRQTLAKLPIQTQDIACFDAGDIVCLDGDLEKAQQALGEAVAQLLQHHITPIVLGGGHELAFGHYQGIAKQSPVDSLGIVNFDAHFDMRPLLPHHQGSSGTPFLQIAQAHENAQRRFHYHCIGIQPTGNIQPLFDTAKQYDVHVLSAEDIHQGNREIVNAFIHHIIQQHQQLYVSLCLDVFAAPYAPGVSAPQPLGLTPWQVIPAIRQLAASGKVISYDIAELSPALDIDHRTAKLAAYFISDIIHYHVIQ